MSVYNKKCHSNGPFFFQTADFFSFTDSRLYKDWLQTGQSESNPGREKIFSSSPKRPERP